MDPGEVPPLRSHRGGNSSGAGPSTSTSSVSAQTNRLAAELSARTTLPQNSRCHAGVAFRPLTFHPVCGTNITLASQGTIASRLETEYTQGYVFTKRPIKVREKLVLQILTTLPAYEGGLALGVTACNPNDLLPNQLPSDSDLLLDRLEYWVVAKDVASKPRQGDELAFYIGNSGEMYYYKNNGPPRVIMHVDQTQALWMFFDLYGNTQRVQLLGTTDVDSRGPETSESRGSRRTSANTSSPSNHPVSEAEQNLINFGPDVPSTPSTSSSTLSTAGLRVNLPPPPEGATPRRPPPPVSTASYTRPPINSRWGNRVPPTPPPRPKPPVKGDAGAGTAAGGGEGAGKVAALGEECTVCMVSPVDCVLYTCGHMCMCFECAQEVRKKSGECPMCRQMIYDVIKTFKA